MNNPKTTSVNASHRPVLIGTLTVFLTVVFGVSLAYGMGLTNPFSAAADTEAAAPSYSGQVESVINYTNNGGKHCVSSTPVQGSSYGDGVHWTCVTDIYFVAPELYPTVENQQQTFDGSISYNGASESFSFSCGPGKYDPNDGSCHQETTKMVGGEEFGLAIDAQRAAAGEGSTVTGSAWPTGSCAAGYTWNGSSCVPQGAAPTCTLSASPDSIAASGSSTLSWTTTDATSFSIDNGVGSVTPVDAGSKTVSPTQTTTYTGTVTGTGGTATCTTTVTIAEVSCEMTATKQSDGTYKISWTESPNDPSKYGFYIDELFNAGTLGPQTTTGSTVVPAPTVTITYHGTVTSAPPDFSPLPAYGHCKVTIPVTPPPSAPTCVLDASPIAITRGESSDLKWTTKNAVSFSIDHAIGSVTPVAAGSHSVSPTLTTTYTGTATAADGTKATCQTTIFVSPPETGPTCSLTAAPASITKGGSSTLSWTTSRATSFSIDQGVGVVTPAAAGSKSVSPTVTTKYTGTATASDGKTATCTATVTVNDVPPAPTCTLTASPTTITTGDPSTLSWTTTNATSFSIDQGIGAVTPVTAGSKIVNPTANTTYTGTATGAGGTVTCKATITVTTLPPGPSCTIIAVPQSIEKGGTSKLFWISHNGVSFSIDQGIGSVALSNTVGYPVSPAQTTTYTGTVTSAQGVTATCHTIVTVTTASAPSCVLTADPTSINKGDSSTLSWSTTNATSFSIDQGIGILQPSTVSVNGEAFGTHVVSPTSDTTYTGTAIGTNGQQVTCTASVNIKSTGGGGLACTLTANPNRIRKGDESTLSWTTKDAVSFSIDQGIGSVTPVDAGSKDVKPTKDTTYTGTATDANGNTVSCSASVDIKTSGGGCSGHCGGSNPPPNILLSATPQPLTYLYLSQIPYTGLDLGPIGTVLYWAVLIGVTLVLAYAILFWVAPFINRKLREFAERVSLVLNAEPASAPVAMATAQEQAAPVIIREPHIEVRSEMLLQAPEAPRGYSSFEGFKSFAKNGALSIEDLVKGLSREKISASGSQPVQAESRNVEPIYQQAEPIQSREVAPARVESAPADVRGLATALIGGDRNAVFAGLRQYVRGGGAPEQLVSSVAFMIDDAYRARIDGTHCDEQIARLTARFDTPTLEKLVASLTTAIDSSYSDAATGAKLAFTRALATIHA